MVVNIRFKHLAIIGSETIGFANARYSFPSHRQRVGRVIVPLGKATQFLHFFDYLAPQTLCYTHKADFTFLRSVWITPFRCGGNRSK